MKVTTRLVETSSNFCCRAKNELGLKSGCCIPFYGSGLAVEADSVIFFLKLHAPQG